MSRKRLKKQVKKTGTTKYLLLVDGETEVWFFNKYKEFLRKNYGKQVPFNIKPKLPENKKLDDIFNEALEAYEQGYDKIFIILDFDQIKHNNQIRKFSSWINKKIIKNNNAIVVLVNNPCWEVWLLMHFRYTGHNFVNCTEVERLLKSSLPSYKKKRQYYNKILQYLNDGTLRTAISNAQRLGAFQLNSQNTAAEVYIFFNFLYQQLRTNSIFY